MSSAIKIAIWSNNSFLEDSFLGQTDSPETQFLGYKETGHAPYVLVLIDLTQDLSNISQRVISFYDECRKHDQKLVVLLLHGQEVDHEKDLYFENLLISLGAGRPLHRLVLVKDLFQPNLLYTETSLEKYILNAISSGKILISSKGENYFYPLTSSDLIAGLKKIYFLNGTAGKSFWLLGDPVTDLDIAYLIKKNLEDSEGPEFEIDANGPNIKLSIDLNSLGNRSRAQLNWEPENDFPSALKEAVKRIGEDRSLLLSKIHQTQSQNRHPKLKKFTGIIFSVAAKLKHLKPKKGIKRSIENGPELLKKVIEVTAAVAVLIYLVVSLSFIVFTALSLKYLEKTLSDIRKGDIAESVKDLGRSTKFSNIGQNSYSFVSPVFSFIAQDFHNKNFNLFVFMHYSQSSLGNLQQTYQLAEKIYQSLGESSPPKFYDDTSLALRSNLGQIYENLNQIKLLSDSNKLPKILTDKLNASEEFKSLDLVEQQISELMKAAELIPAFLAGDSAKNIIVLFQNSQELRSTGGAIDYVLSLVLDQGRVVSQKVYRSDEIDTLVVDKVAAPPLIRQYTGVDEWKVRDMNYNPDFPQTATNISWIIKSALKFSPNVIVAVTEDLFNGFLAEEKNILNKGQNITTEIFTGELSTTSPSPLYKDLIEQYLDRILKHQLPLITLGRVIAKESEKNIHFWTSDNSIERSLINQSYAGSIYPHACHGGLSGSRDCIAQTTYFNESNFSLISLKNKLQRKIIHQIAIENNLIRHEYQIEYQFAEKIPNLNRDLNYIIQLYLPENSILDEAVINDKNISSKQIIVQLDNRLQRFQIPLALVNNQPNKLVFKFNTPLTRPFYLPLAYSITEYHQSGVLGQDLELRLTYPESAKPAAITSQVTTGPNSLILGFPPKTSTFGVNFAPNDR